MKSWDYFDHAQKPKVFSPLVLVREGQIQAEHGLNISGKVRLIDKSHRETSKSVIPGHVISTPFGQPPFSYAVYANYFTTHLCCCHQGLYGVQQHFPPLHSYLNFQCGKEGFRDENVRGSVSSDGLPPDTCFSNDQESSQGIHSPDSKHRIEHSNVSGNVPSSAIPIRQHKLLESQRDAQRRTRRPKTYKCPYCDVCCSNQGQLRGHVRIHTGERPYRCSANGCTKAFIRNEELTRHRRIHTGERPHKCDVCGKAFSRKDHLNKHVRVHAYENEPNNI